MNSFFVERIETIADLASHLSADLVSADLATGASILLVAYLAGSIASALVVCRILDLPDPRGQGSGNPGATNMLRIGGKGAAALTLGGDALKGTVSVLLARWILPEASSLALLAVFLGHLYPIWFRFQGGKGMATMLGGLVALSWPLALVAGGVWLAVAALARYSSLASMMAAVGVFAASFWLPVASESPAFLDRLALGIVALSILWRHRDNIRRLIDGSESRIGRRA